MSPVRRRLVSTAMRSAPQEMSLSTLHGRSTSMRHWLAHAERLHPMSIEMGLERVGRVAARLGLRFDMPVISVTGTNGKGSVCAMLEAMLLAAGCRTGVYLSPQLLRFNERCRIDGVDVDDDALALHMAAVEGARQGVQLTQFEFTTLAILRLISRCRVDVAVLEVGLGGRLDAVNIVDADCAVLTSIGLDHLDVLGPDRHAIAREKAGLARAGRPFIVAEPRPPSNLAVELSLRGAWPVRFGRDYCVRVQGDGSWSWHGGSTHITGLPLPMLPGSFQIGNAAAAVAALVTLSDRLSVSVDAVSRGLISARLPGRLQRIGEEPQVVVDVGHNAHAARAISRTLKERTGSGRVKAVFGAMKDKDIDAIFRTMSATVQDWYLCELDSPRGAAAPQLAHSLKRCCGIGPKGTFPDPVAALSAARCDAATEDLVIVFGSFLAVGPVLANLPQFAAARAA